tara:strand:+ start:817 stop:1971 length:1155 start_codon:yes stop_codon:yes gene_type:complete
MAKRPTTTSITTGHASITALNNNITALRNHFDNTLSRDGSAPNTMSADIDLNGNDLNNVGALKNTSGQDIVALTQGFMNTANTAATNAGNSATASASSASSSATSATASGNSATASASSATGAASSATAAAATLDTFDDRFLGAKSSNPSTDNDGDALATGALYFNTGDNNMRVYNGSAWQAVGPTTAEQTNINTVAAADANITTVVGQITPTNNIQTVAQNASTLNSLNAMFTAVENITVTVVNDGGNKFAFNGVTAPAITLVKGFTYTFDVSASSVSGHPLAFKDSGGNAFTTGVTTNGTAGSAGANVVIAVPSTGTMPARYYCTTHGNGMGNTIATQTNDIATVADSTTITNINTIVNNLSTISAKASLDDATALAIALGG